MLASAAVVVTAGVASASIALGVGAPHAPTGLHADSTDPDGGPDDADGSDSLDIGGFDIGGEGGFDSATDAGFDIGGEAGPTDTMMVPDIGFPDGPGSDAMIPDGMIPDGGMPPTISIMEPSISIIGPQGTTSVGTATIYTMNTGTLGTAAIFSADTSMQLVDCAATMCSYGGQSVMPPYPLQIECVPDVMATFGTLYITEESSGTFTMASVSCSSTASGPALAVNPDQLPFGDVDVGQNATEQIYISNTGGGTLSNIEIDFGASANAVHWRASMCTPTTGGPCSVGAGSGFPVDITFEPTSHGIKDVTLTVTSNGGTDNVALMGTGIGGVMSVKTPPGPMHILDFGTIPRNQEFSRDIEIENTGNGLYTAATTTPAVPYTIAPGPFPVLGGTTAAIRVDCESPTATATNNPQSIVITSDAYQGNSATVQLRCKVADTLLQITPTMFDFGEVRVGTQPQPTLDITLTNPITSATAVQITKFALRLNKPGLQLTAPATPFSIAPGSLQNATLQLSTAADTELEGEFLELTVDGVDLAFPVTGRVVTPHSRVVPNRLDLGTACVGTEISGNVMLINDGTATLNVDPPVMDQSFVASAMGVPGTLAPTKSITAMVSPMMTASGPVEGTLSWHDDVPNDHVIPVVLDYVSSGTALSPRGLDFGVVEVDQPTGAQHIKLQNCDLTPTRIKIESLKTKEGTLGAWIIDPRVGYTKDLIAKEQQAITVTFEPPARGRYEADLTVTTASGKQVVHLVGDATGRDFDNTSFYACACSGPGAPSRGWPVLLAVVLVIFRRRRVSSSAR